MGLDSDILDPMSLNKKITSLNRTKIVASRNLLSSCSGRANVERLSLSYVLCSSTIPSDKNQFVNQSNNFSKHIVPNFESTFKYGMFKIFERPLNAVHI